MNLKSYSLESRGLLPLFSLTGTILRIIIKTMPAQTTYLKPGFMLTKLINPVLIMLELISTLSVKGRISGKWIRTPITPIEYAENMYLGELAK